MAHGAGNRGLAPSTAVRIYRMESRAMQRICELHVLAARPSTPSRPTMPARCFHDALRLKMTGSFRFAWTNSS